MNLETAKRKIAACLARAQSSNENEAEIAMRQAQLLMKEYNLNQGQAEASQIKKAEIKADTSSSRPQAHKWALAHGVASAFGCEVFFTRPRHGYGWAGKAAWVFYGPGVSPELAAYAFDVLYRQMIKDRKEFLKLIKCRKKSNKTLRANAFCAGWVMSVREQCQKLKPDTQMTKEALDEFRKSESIKEQKQSQVNKKVRANDLARGMAAGADAYLNKATAMQQRTAIGSAK